MTTRTHSVRIHPVDRLESPGVPSSAGVLVNVYQTDSYVVVNAGLPRCRPENIQVTVAPGELLIEAHRHDAQEAVEAERHYLMAQLPIGAIQRVVPIPKADLALEAAEAHFANGMLIVTMPTQARDAYLTRMRGRGGQG